MPPQLAPLRTQPVAVARGSAVALQGGQASCEFSAGLMAVAAMLARWVLWLSHIAWCGGLALLQMPDTH